MSEPIKVSTGKYRNEGKVEIDGNVWSIKLPGAGTELKLSQAQRRMERLDKKIKDGIVTDADLDMYDEYEMLMYTSFKDMLSDGTENNAAVAKWVEETPLAIIMAVFDDIKEVANGRTNAASDT